MNKRLLKGILIFLLGIGIIIITIIAETQLGDNSFRAGIFTGFGAGIAGVAIIDVLKTIRYRNNPDKLIKEEMLSNEERQVMIREKAGSIAFSASNLTTSAIILLLAFVNPELEIILIICGGMMINVVVFVCMFNYYNKKY